MKKAIITGFLALGSAACGGTATMTTQNTTATNTANAPTRKADETLVTTGHSAPQKIEAPMQTPPVGAKTENNPMAKATDVTALTADIEKAEKTYKEKSTDAKAKSDLAKAYFARAFILTDAAQYRAALGDFRKGLKLDPNDKDAKDMHDQILQIFKGLNREPPKEGEEPAPMPIE